MRTGEGPTVVFTHFQEWPLPWGVPEATSAKDQVKGGAQGSDLLPGGPRHPHPCCPSVPWGAVAKSVTK